MFWKEKTKLVRSEKLIHYQIYKMLRSNIVQGHTRKDEFKLFWCDTVLTYDFQLAKIINVHALIFLIKIWITTFNARFLDWECLGLLLFIAAYNFVVDGVAKKNNHISVLSKNRQLTNL